jgi:hypothetical protein
MRNNILIIVTLISVIASLALVSCQSNVAVKPTGPSIAAEKVSSTTPVATTSAPTVTTLPQTTTNKPVETLTTTVPTTTAASSPTPATSSVVQDLPDLKPYLVDGKSAVTVDTSSTDYKKFLIKAGLSNAGKATAENATLTLYNSGTTIYTWSVSLLKAGENRVLQATIEDILKQKQISAGQYTFSTSSAVVGGGKESDSNNNWSDTYFAMLGAPPVAARDSQSAMEKKIQDSIKNNTWYTATNRADFVTILKDILKDANISWNTFSMEIWPADKYADLYANTFGTSDFEKLSLKNSKLNNKLADIGFLYGNTGAVNICVREGTLMQMLPAVLFQLGIVDYAQINYTGYSTSSDVYGQSYSGYLMQAYGIRVMKERYGLAGLINISASINTIQYPSLTGTGSSSINLRRLWALAIAEGYPDGDMTADKILKAYFKFTSAGSPATFLADYDNKADAMDKKAVETILQWRRVNKNITPLTGDVSSKVGTNSLDMIISYQLFASFPI